MRERRRFRPLDRARVAFARLCSERHHAAGLGNPLISVVLELGSAAEPLLDRTLRSVLAQTYTHLELLLAGDPELTARLERTFADPRIRGVVLPASGERPLGPELLGHARGLWIAPVEAGDVFTPDHLERLLLFAHRHGREFVSARHACDGPLALRASAIGAPGTWLYRSYLHALHARILSRRPRPADLGVRARDAGVRMGFLPERVTLSSPRAIETRTSELAPRELPRPTPQLRVVR